MGTPEFAVPSLRVVHGELGVRAVVTVPDKPSGRGQNLTSSAVKDCALQLGIPILQPTSLRDSEFKTSLESLDPDIIVVVAFRILPREIYSLARVGAFNIHGSLLPKYRGAAPIQWAIINGEIESGVTSFLLNDKVDTGSIIDQRICTIPDGMTAGELYGQLKIEASTLSVQTCRTLIAGNVQTHNQSEELSSSAPKIFREMCEINLAQTARAVRNFIHGVNPNPGAWVVIDGHRIKLWRGHVSELKGTTGSFEISNSCVLLFAEDFAVEIDELQLEGKPRRTGAEFANGWRGAKTGIVGSPML